MQCRNIILEMAEEKKDQRHPSPPAESQQDSCGDDGDQQADSLAQDVERKLTIAVEHKPKVDEAQPHQRQHQQRQQSTIVCDAWYGLPTQKRPRRERVNAIARQLRNVEQSALLAKVANSKQGCGVRVVLIGKESDVLVIGERLEKLREEDGGTNDDLSNRETCRVEMLPNVSVEEACRDTRFQEVDESARANDDTEILVECHDKPTYLSPDADATLDPRKSPPRTVVVGMLIDRRVQPNRSSERAEKIDVPAARLPMDELKVEGLETNEALNVDTVLEMMVCWWDKVDGLHVHDGRGNAHVGNEDDDDDDNDNGNSFRKCFIAAASAAMVSHEDRHPNRAIHGTGTCC